MYSGRVYNNGQVFVRVDISFGSKFFGFWDIEFKI